MADRLSVMFVRSIALSILLTVSAAHAQVSVSAGMAHTENETLATVRIGADFPVSERLSLGGSIWTTLDGYERGDQNETPFTDQIDVESLAGWEARVSYALTDRASVFVGAGQSRREGSFSWTCPLVMDDSGNFCAGDGDKALLAERADGSVSFSETVPAYRVGFTYSLSERFALSLSYSWAEFSDAAVIEQAPEYHTAPIPSDDGLIMLEGAFRF